MNKTKLLFFVALMSHVLISCFLISKLGKAPWCPCLLFIVILDSFRESNVLTTILLCNWLLLEVVTVQSDSGLDLSPRVLWLHSWVTAPRSSMLQSTYLLSRFSATPEMQWVFKSYNSDTNAQIRGLIGLIPNFLVNFSLLLLTWASTLVCVRTHTSTHTDSF